MGKIIACSARIAEHPYITKETHIKLYSIEEICHYVRVNIYSIGLDFFDAGLINFIKNELGLKDTAEKLKNAVLGSYLLDAIAALFCGCDLYDREEIVEAIELVKYLTEMPDWERRAYIGYKKLEERKYLIALKYFRETLKDENIAEKTYGKILKAMGTCMIYVSSFTEASECFYRSYRYTEDEATLMLAVLALRLGSQEKEFLERARGITKDEKLIDAAEKIWKEAEKKALNGGNIKNLNNIFEKLKTDKVAEGYREIEAKLEEFKEEYREGAWNGLIS